MRLYANLHEALSEIQRDVAKGPKITSSRVQQRVGQDLPGRELLGYSYAIEEDGVPTDLDDFIAVVKPFDFPAFADEGRIRKWLRLELSLRLSGSLNLHVEESHPALRGTIEGNWPAYTYGERLNGSIEALISALKDSPDSRRAYWPIFRTEDALRAGAPTRIPCSLGYQLLIRNTLNGPRLVMVYMQRSADFDMFLVSDIWLASRFQKYIAEGLGVAPGQFIHFITSLHSFLVEDTEIY